MAAAAGLPNASLGALGSQRGNVAAAGGAGGGAAAMGGAGGGCPRDALLEPPSDKFLTPKTRAPAIIEGKEGKYSFKIRDREKCRGYFQPRILIDNEIAAASDGIYTWIFKYIPGCGRHLFAIRTVISQEVGTLHRNLNEYTRGDEKRVIIAGELRISEDASKKKTFEFNKLSGSFTADLDEAEQTARMGELARYASSIGIEPTLIDAPIINSAANVLILPAGNIENYESFCNLGPFREPLKDLTTTKKRRLKGGARRIRKSRKHQRRRKSRRTLRRGQ